VTTARLPQDSDASVGQVRARDGEIREPSLSSVQVDDPNARFAIQVDRGDSEKVTSLVTRQDRDHDRFPRPHQQPEFVSDHDPVLLGAVSNCVVWSEH
jgi:hypothetical protein